MKYFIYTILHWQVYELVPDIQLPFGEQGDD